ncbi:MAG: hypothetical protein AB1467_06740 [Candidatus Diapherotrites archaeon]
MASMGIGREKFNHTELKDMPDSTGINTDHDQRYGGTGWDTTTKLKNAQDHIANTSNPHTTTFNKCYDAEPGATRTITVDDGNIHYDLNASYGSSIVFGLDLNPSIGEPSYTHSIFRIRDETDNNIFVVQRSRLTAIPPIEHSKVMTVNWYPGADNTYDLGGTDPVSKITYRWKDLYLAGTIKGTASPIENISINAASGDIKLLGLLKDADSGGNELTVANAKAAYNHSQTITGNPHNLDTDDVPEGITNLYLTNERIDDRTAALIQNGTGLTWTYDDILNTLTGNVSLTPFNTNNLSEGTTNFYYTETRFNSSFSEKTTDNLTQGTTNKYYSTTLFNTDFASKTLDDLANGITYIRIKKAQKEVLHPEFAGAVLTGTSTTGSMTSDADITNNHNYYQWSGGAADDTYSIEVMFTLPQDFNGWQANAIIINFKTQTITVTDNSLDFYIYKNGTLITSSTGKVSSVADTWTTTTITSTSMGAWTAGDDLRIKCTLKSDSSATKAYLGEIELQFNAGA